MGKAYKFDGTDDKVTFQPSAKVTHAKFTISVWAKAETLTQADNAGVFNSGNTGNDFQLEAHQGEWRIGGDKGGTQSLGDLTTEWTHLSSNLRW